MPRAPSMLVNVLGFLMLIWLGLAPLSAVLHIAVKSFLIISPGSHNPHSSFHARLASIWTTTRVVPNKGLTPQLSAPRFAAVPFRP